MWKSRWHFLKMNKTIKKKEKDNLWVYVVWALVCFLVGLLIGMMFQQMIFLNGLVEFGLSLEGVNLEVNVDLNETLLVEGVNQTIHDNLKLIEEIK